MVIPQSSVDPFRGKEILVTGGAGFVGSNLVKALLRGEPKKITVIDNLLSAEKVNLPERPDVVLLEGSCADDAILSRAPKPVDYAFHLATYHGNQSSIADPIADHANNTLTSLKLFEHLKSYPNLTKVVYSSAGCTVAEKTYDDAEATTEEAPVSLYHDSPYQISKLIGELYGNYYFLRHKLPIVKARFQNVYGPGEILGAGRWRGTPATVWRNVTPTFIWRSLAKEALPVENGGVATRDFIFVEDIVHGLIRCATHGTAGEVYNLASAVETSILDLANAINRLTGNPTPIAMTPARPWDRSGKRYGSGDKAKTAIGFEAKVPLEEGLKVTVEWTKANKTLIESCIKKHDAQMKAANAA